MNCQHINCNKDVKWRIVDKYRQQSMTFTYFYYVCDLHKTTKEFPGHSKTSTPYLDDNEQVALVCDEQVALDNLPDRFFDPEDEPREAGLSPDSIPM